jgi:hypothetical protein
MTRRIETGVMIMTIRRVLVGTWLASSLHQRSTAEDVIETTVTCVTSSTVELHMAELKTSIEIGSEKSKNIVMKGPYYDQPHWEHSPEGGHILGGIKAYSRDLKRVRWLVNFKTSGIEKYDLSTSLTEWLEVYQLTIEAARGNSYVMANYLLVCLSSSARTWLLGLPAGSVRSWNHLCQLFTSNFRAMCVWLGVDWDLGSVVQKKGESLREYI